MNIFYKNEKNIFVKKHKAAMFYAFSFIIKGGF